MRIHQRDRREGTWQLRGTDDGDRTQLVLVFSSACILAEGATWNQLRSFYPTARVVACSTAGEISDTTVQDDSLACTGISFEHSQVAISAVLLGEAQDSETLGAVLLSRLPMAGLTHVFILSDGLKVNGSALLLGIARRLPAGVRVTGGLSGDGVRFKATAVCLDGPHPNDQIVAIGFYGPRLRIGFGSQGGWDPFGVERQVTKSEGNVLYELDGEPALDLYKRYLGDKAVDLPSAGLRFPLAIRDGRDADAVPVVRTILSVDENARTLTFAGDVPTGYRARLMSANVERLLDGAREAAMHSRVTMGSGEPELAILISCVGRKLVLKQRVEEEVEVVREALGASAAITGFYSYGELSPFSSSGRCEFHNQTMTITTLSER
jgi:hypothetical protein